jgi:thioredoxin 1
MIQDITTLEELNTIAETFETIVIDFYADWCGPCKKLKPFFLELSENEIYKEIKFLKVNADDDEDLCTKYSIVGLPTVVFLNQQCQVMDKVIGFDPDKITKILNRIVEKEIPEHTTTTPSPKQDIFNLDNFKL